MNINQADAEGLPPSAASGRQRAGAVEGEGAPPCRGHSSEKLLGTAERPHPHPQPQPARTEGQHLLQRGGEGEELSRPHFLELPLRHHLIGSQAAHVQG